jgi:hypothetical protein
MTLFLSSQERDEDIGRISKLSKKRAKSCRRICQPKMPIDCQLVWSAAKLCGNVQTFKRPLRSLASAGSRANICFPSPLCFATVIVLRHLDSNTVIQ